MRIYLSLLLLMFATTVCCAAAETLDDKKLLDRANIIALDQSKNSGKHPAENWRLIDAQFIPSVRWLFTSYHIDSKPDGLLADTEDPARIEGLARGRLALTSDSYGKNKTFHEIDGLPGIRAYEMVCDLGNKDIRRLRALLFSPQFVKQKLTGAITGEAGTELTSLPDRMANTITTDEPFKSISVLKMGADFCAHPGTYEKSMESLAFMLLTDHDGLVRLDVLLNRLGKSVPTDGQFNAANIVAMESTSDNASYRMRCTLAISCDPVQHVWPPAGDLTMVNHYRKSGPRVSVLLPIDLDIDLKTGELTLKAQAPKFFK